MQNQVATSNNTPIKRNNLKSKSEIHDRDFRKFWRYFFPFYVRWNALFWAFEILKAPHKFELKCLQVLVFDNRQVKWLQTRKRKLPKETPKSLEKFVKELRESRSQLLYWLDILNIPKNSEKNVLARPEICNRGVFRRI